MVVFPLLVIPLGLSIVGLWWLLSDQDGDDSDDSSDNDYPDGGF